jgi:hypothetical protein
VGSGRGKDGSESPCFSSENAGLFSANVLLALQSAYEAIEFHGISDEKGDAGLDMNSQSHGVFLYSLDSESDISPETAFQAIVFESLFSRQVCLNESHLLDNRAVWKFFEDNINLLEESLSDRDLDEVPIIGLCSREPSVPGVLDLWLGSKTDVPNYFSSLSPEQNSHLQDRYPRTKAGRRDRLYKIEPRFASLATVFERYFQRLPPLTFVPRTGQPDRDLYAHVDKELKQLISSGASLGDEDKPILEAIQRVISGPSALGQTRAALHKAIYGGTQPRFHEGKITQHKGTVEPHAIKDEWRFYINAIYNYNLAKSLNARPVLNTGLWPVGHRWIAEAAIQQRLRTDNVGTLEVPVPLYRDKLDLKFAIKVRKTRRFRENISKLDEALTSGESDRLMAAKEGHVSFLSDQFANYLVEHGSADLVGVRVKQFAVSLAERISEPLALGGPVLTALLTHYGAPADSAAEVGQFFAETSPRAFCLLVEGLISVSPRKLQEKLIRSPDFKSVVMEFEKRSGV